MPRRSHKRNSTTQMSPMKGLSVKSRLWLLFLSAAKACALIMIAQFISLAVVDVIEQNSQLSTHLLLLAVGISLLLIIVPLRSVSYMRLAVREKTGERRRILRRLRRPIEVDNGYVATLATHGLDELDAFYTDYMPAMFDTLVIPIFVIGWLWLEDWPSGLIVLLTLPLIPIFMVLIGRYTKEHTLRALSSLSRLSAHLIELARGLTVLSGLGRADEQVTAIKKLSEGVRRHNMASMKIALLSALALELIAMVSVAVVAVIIGVRLLYGLMPLETGLMCLILAPEAFSALRAVGSAFHASSAGTTTREELAKIFAKKPRNGRLSRHTKKVCFRDVTIGFPDRNQLAVSRISFSTGERGITLINGRSGSGKSTILSAIVGALPTSASLTGEITAPENVLWLPQQPIFAHMRVREELSSDNMLSIEQQGIIDDFGLTQLLDKAPDQLSPGEQRRLMLVSLYFRSRPETMLVLDEPTAHLDKGYADMARRLIKRLAKDHAVIIATHDSYLQKAAKKTVLLDSSSSTLAEVDNHQSQQHIKPAVLVDPITSDERKEHWIIAKEMKQLSRDNGWPILRGIIPGIIAPLFAIALTAVSGWLIVRASQQPPVLTLMVAIVGVRFFGIGRAALYYWSRLATHDAVFASIVSLRTRLWKGLSRRGPAYRSLLSSGSVVDRVLRDSERVQNLIPRTVQPLSATFFVIIASLLALQLLYPAGWPAYIAVVGAIVLVAVLVVRLSDVIAGRYLRYQSQLTEKFTRLIIARQIARINRQLDQVGQSIMSDDSSLGRLSVFQAGIEGAGQSLMILLGYGLSFCLLYLAGQEGAIPPALQPIVAVLALIPLGLVPELSDTVSSLGKIPLLRQVIRRTNAITNYVSAENIDQGGEDISGVRSLDARNLTFSYPRSTRQVINNLSFSVSTSKWLHVHGPSGSGKSTLLALLLLYLQPTGGTYRVNAVPSSRLRPSSLRRKMVWCPQESHLFDSTLRANLLLARSRQDAPDDNEMMRSLQRSGLQSLLMQLPEGLDTYIGPGGSQLSGGERQRLAIARTLLARADAVLLDEPTAYLDSETSAALMADLKDALQENLVVIVSHQMLNGLEVAEIELSSE